MFNSLSETISKLDPIIISEDRKKDLLPLITFIKQKAGSSEAIRLNFICTHNSRRSHLSQVWAQTLAFHFKVANVFCYSGGTEATAIFPQVIKALQNAGFQSDKLSEEANPIYALKYATEEHPIIAFSKKFDATFNPSANFVAILTCTEADGACPFIAGAEQRVSLPFEDPKLFDGTPQQAEKYEERSLQIATEMFYVFSQITLNNG